MCIGAILFFNVFCSNSSQQGTDTEQYLNHNDSVQYVGINVCKTCHYDKYETYIHTGMGNSFGAATKSKSAGEYHSHHAVYDKYLDFYYLPYFLKDTMYIMEYRLEGKDTVHKRIEKVDYIVGSGQHTNSHMYVTNGYFHQMPLTFYTQQQRWDLPPGFENGHNSRFSRTIELECMSCHNAYPKFVAGSRNKYASVLQGIDCERCHGPGSLHVRERSSGTRVDTANYIDYTIVNPKKLSYDLQVDVCQRCHLQGNAVLAEGKTFFDFKPGEKLSDYMNIFLPRYEGNNSQFIMASHADRLKQSKCFIESTRMKIRTEHKSYLNSSVKNTNVSSLTCISCHDPHVSVKETQDEQFNRTCKSCHGAKDLSQLSLCSEKIEVRKIKNDNCWKCHMPNSGTIDIPHVTVHDHRIQVPVKHEDKKEIAKFIGIAAINNPNPDAHIKAEAYLSYYEKFDRQERFLDSAAFYFSGKGSYSDQHLFNNMIRLYFLRSDYQALLRYAEKRPANFSKDAWTHYRIGEAWLSEGNTDKAYRSYKLAVDYAPYNLEFRNKLGNTEAAKGDLRSAQNTFEFIVKENPKNTPGLSNLAFIYMNENRIREADDLLTRALALDPDYEQALMNKAALLVYSQKNKEAKKILERIIKNNPANQKARQLIQTL